MGVSRALILARINVATRQPSIRLLGHAAAAAAPLKRTARDPLTLSIRSASGSPTGIPVARRRKTGCAVPPLKQPTSRRDERAAVRLLIIFIRRKTVCIRLILVLYVHFSIECLYFYMYTLFGSTTAILK